MDATSAPQEALEEAALAFFGPQSFTFEKCTGGVNNRLYKVQLNNGSETFVLRIYNNGGFTERVEYEHAILEKLKGRELPFEVPQLVPSAVNSGALAIPLKSMNGAQACVFRFIQGKPAKNTSVLAHSCGRATAILLKAMADIRLGSCPNPRFRDVYEACPGRKMLPEQIERILQGPEFDEFREETTYLQNELARVAGIANSGELQLREQQIHADLHTDNFLSTDTEVTGVLDFEFSAFDWTVMEVAVGLTKYLGNDETMQLISNYIEGFKKGGGSLTISEIRFLCDGMVLRILSNVVFFAGRATASPPQDNIGTLVSKVVPYAKRCRWIEANRGTLEDLLLRDSK